MSWILLSNSTHVGNCSVSEKSSEQCRTVSTPCGHEINHHKVLVLCQSQGCNASTSKPHLPDNMHRSRVILLLVYAHHEHGGVGRGGRDDDLLGPSRDVGSGLVSGGEDPSGLDHIVSARFPPGNGGWVTAGMNTCKL